MTPAPDVSWYWSVAGMVAVPALVAANGFFVAAEFSLVAIRRTKVEEMVKHGRRGAKYVAEATNSLDRALAASQLGITLASLALGWLGEPALARLIEPWFHWLPEKQAAITTHGAATAVAFAAITFMHIVFGELVPRTLALQSVDTTSLWLARPLLIFLKISRPIAWVIHGSANLVLRLFGFRPAGGADMVHSVEELQLLIEDTEEAGIIDEEQAGIVQNVFELANKRVRDCMVPVENMASLDLNMTPEQIMQAVRAGAHTRMPVYDGTPDKVVGIVNTKDLFYLFSLRGVVVLEDAIYPATYLGPEETIANALKLLKKSRKPMALVCDDQDKTLGMITLEDVMEEIVGDIEDEHDRPMRRLVLRRMRPPTRRP